MKRHVCIKYKTKKLQDTHTHTAITLKVLPVKRKLNSENFYNKTAHERRDCL